MTHGYHNIFGGGEDWTDLLTSGNATLETVAQDWIFGTTTTPPVTGGGWRKPRKRRTAWDDDDEELIFL